MENLLIENVLGHAPIIFFAGGFLSIFKSKKKPNLTPGIVPMDYGNLYHTPELRQFASDRISGKTAGFGDQFVDKASNPVIASREARYREQEIPQLSSQLSARGLARSAGPNLATDVLTRAGQQKERDINEVLAQFYTLNEAQKKRDIGEGVGVAERSSGQQERMQAAQARESRTQIEQTAAQQRAYEQQDRGDLDRIGAMVATAIGGLSGGFGGGTSPTMLGSMPNVGQVSTYGTANIPQGFSSLRMPSVGSNILGQTSSSQLRGLDVQSLLGLLGG